MENCKKVILQAQDLQARDFSGTADPYAKIRLLPDKTNVWQTRIHKKTLNPGKKIIIIQCIYIVYKTLKINLLKHFF